MIRQKLAPCHNCFYENVVLVNEKNENGDCFFVKCIRCRKISPKLSCSHSSNLSTAIENTRKMWNEIPVEFKMIEDNQDNNI